jgi:hypothetical protein
MTKKGILMEYPFLLSMRRFRGIGVQYCFGNGKRYKIPKWLPGATPADKNT